MQIETRRSRQRTRTEPCDPAGLERRIRQRLADKVSGNLAGLWLLVAEHLRLGIWDLLYNAPNTAQLRDRYEHLPEKLCAENIPPHVPWLYNYKLDFRFR